MSLLLKALKQAESTTPAGQAATAGKPGLIDLELEPVSPLRNEAAHDWVEPPAMLFGSSGLSPAQPASPRFRLPHLGLVPTTALLAVIVALGYGIYLYLALQPAPLPPPPAKAAPPAVQPILAAAPSPPAPLPQPAAPAARPPQAVASTSIGVALRPSEGIPQRAAAKSAPAVAPVAQPTPSPASAIPVFRPDANATLLGSAHAAYQAGHLDEARRLYAQAAAQTSSTDALLGLAAIAIAQNRESDAVQHYRDILQRDPRNAAAQASLLDLAGDADSLASESRLKTLIDRDPGPHLYQTLGNLYAEQQRWPEAQTAYFEAFRTAPGNADYAFNLAVSLDMLRQYAAALLYYEKALALGGTHRFDRGQAEARIRQLKQVL